MPRRNLFMPCPLYRGLRLSSVVLLLGLSGLKADQIANPGFEQDIAEWLAQKDRGMSAASPEAAHTGKLGLRVTDNDPNQGSGLISLPASAEAGKKYELSCWGRGVSGSGGVGVYLRFLDGAEKVIGKPKYIVVPSEAREWKQYTLQVVAPPETAAFDVWIHSFAKDTPVVDLDDFEIKELPAE